MKEGIPNPEEKEIDEIYQKAREYIDKYALNPEKDFTRDDFANEEEYKLFLEELKRDLQHLSYIENEIKKKENEEQRASRELSEIMEAIIATQAEVANWFGEQAMSITPSRYDDVINSCDLIVEFPEQIKEQDCLALAMDVTYGNFDTLRRKIKKIEEKIKNGKLELKYFASEKRNKKGVLQNIPLFAIGIGPQTVKQLSQMWNKKQNQELAEHPVQNQILAEIIMEAHNFEQLALKYGQKEIAQAYQETKKLIAKILIEKRKLGIRMRPDQAYGGLEKIFQEAA